MKYTVTTQEKITIWEQCTLEIEAESQEEANAKAIQLAESRTLWDAQIESEMLYDTVGVILPSENEGRATIELYEGTETTKPFYKNGK